MSIDRIAAGLWTFLAYFGLIMLAGAENAMSAYAGYNFGTHDLERYLYAAAYSGNELLKVALLWKLGQAFAQPGSLTVKALRIGVGALVLTPLVLLISLSGHVGFVGLVRGDTVAVRTAALVKTDDAAAVIKADQAQLDQMRTNRKWSASRQCTNATLDTTISFCKEYRKVEARVERARATLGTTAAVGLADPQVDILTMLFPGREKKELQLGLALAVGGAISFISFLGFFVAGHHHAKVADVEGLKDMAEKLREGEPDATGTPALGRRTLKTAEEVELERFGITGSPVLVGAVRSGIIEHPGVKHVIAWLEDRVDYEAGGKLHVTAAYTDYHVWFAQRPNKDADLTRDPLTADVFWNIARNSHKTSHDGKSLINCKLRYAAANDQRGVA